MVPDLGYTTPIRCLPHCRLFHLSFRPEGWNPGSGNREARGNMLSRFLK